jgi:formylglycine-generating enzyme required for sulfatase activity
MKPRVLLLLACLLGFTDVRPLVAQPPTAPKHVALVALAGDDKKGDITDRLLSRVLPGEVALNVGRGAPRLAAALARQGWEVRTRFSPDSKRRAGKGGDAPTEANLRDFLKGLAALRPDDEVIVVLVGHMVSLEAGAGEAGSGLYFCPQDAAYEGLTKAVEVKPGHHLLPLADVYDRLKACPARKKLLVLVTAPARMDEAEKYKPPLCAVLPKLPPPPDGVAVLTSCAEGECTAGFRGFLFALELGLINGHADGAPDFEKRDGRVTAEEWVVFAQARTRDNGENTPYPFSQQPQLLGRLPRNWVLARTDEAGGTPRPAGRPTREALLVQAYDYRRRHQDQAMQAVRVFPPYGLAKQLTHDAWDAHLWMSGLDVRWPPPPDEAPTEVNLRRYLKGLAALRPDDEVIVVLVGQMISLEAGKGTARVYFLPEDADYRKPARAADVKPAHHLLALEDVYDYLKACSARRKLLVLVTALSDYALGPGKYPRPVCARLPKLPAPPAGLTVLTSCAEGEFTSNLAEFLQSLEKGLSGLKADGAPDGKTRDGAVTVEELLAFAREAIQDHMRDRDIPQQPTVLGEMPRNWVLAGKPAPARREVLSVPFSADEASRRQKETARALKLDGPVVTNSLGMKLAVIPPGDFRLGSDQGYDDERPRPLILLSRPFLLGQHEVTQGQYQRVMGDNPSFFKKVPGQDTKDFPVEQVTFKQAVLFCNALSEREKLPPYYRLLKASKDNTGRVIDFEDYAPTGSTGYRLPTEAEWEWACRAGTDTAFSFGDKLGGKQANVDADRPGGVAEGIYLGRTAKVGSYAPNPWGLYDMHGNVAERVEESYDPTRYKKLAREVTDGSGGVGYGGLARGGAWNFAPRDCRSAVRVALPPDMPLKFVGFRVARDAE